MTNLVLERIRRNRRVSGVLAEMCDFGLSSTEDLADWFRIECAEQFEGIGRDSSGGVFLLAGSGRLLHLTSEGQAGVLASGLLEAVAMFAALPYWRDLLKFSAGGMLSEMKRVAPYLESDLLRDEPECARQRRIVCSELALPGLTDPVASLHDAVTSFGADLIVKAPDGSAFAPLFNTFTVDNYLAYRRT